MFCLQGLLLHICMPFCAPCKAYAIDRAAQGIISAVGHHGVPASHADLQHAIHSTFTLKNNAQALPAGTPLCLGALLSGTSR